jgi:HEAT repeat protein
LLGKKDHYDYLNDIRRGGSNAQWQSAYELAIYLRQSNVDKIIDDHFLDELIDIHTNTQFDDPRIQRYLTLALGNLKSPRALTSLRHAIGDSDDETRLYALWAMGNIGTGEIQSDIERQLNSGDPALRKLAAHLLGSYDNLESKEALNKALDDPIEDVTWNAALSLSKLNDLSGLYILSKMIDRQYLNEMPGMTEDLKKQTILSAIQAISKLDTLLEIKDQISILKNNDPDHKIRQAASAVLEKINLNN